MKCLSSDVSYIPISALVPHKAPMLLIHELLSVTQTEITVLVDLSKGSLFHNEQGQVPSYVGIEYIAQATAALVGFERYQQRLEIKLGFLLGTRSYESKVAFFSHVNNLTVHIKEMMRDNEVGVYEGEILCQDEPIAHAQIKAVMPENPEKLL